MKIQRMITALLIIVISTCHFAFAQKTILRSIRTIKNANVDGTMMSSGNDLMTNLSSSQDFSVLVSLIKAADFTDKLKQKPITLIAPTNKIFELYKAHFLDTLLLADHKIFLQNFLNSMIIRGKLSSRDIVKLVKSENGEAAIKTNSSKILKFQINAERNIVVIDELGRRSIVTKLDIEQSNGELLIVENYHLLQSR